MSDERTYKTGEVATLFGVAPETIRSWTDKFSEFLTDDATASGGTHRVYYYNDLRVLAFIDEQRTRYNHDDIYASLKVTPAENLPEPTEPLSANLSFNEIGMKVEQLQQAYIEKTEELEDAKLELARMEERVKQAESTEVDLKAAQIRIEKLLTLNAKLRVMLAIEKGESVDLDE